MTSRERLLAAGSGSPVDRKPLIAWPTPSALADAEVNGRTAGDKLFLIEVLNPFGLGIQQGIDLNGLLTENPEAGDKVHSQLIDQCRASIQAALAKGADGVLYRLHGARALHTTPMQYGGHYLERDREILAEVNDAGFNLIFVVGEDDAYLDFVSDLPAQAFGWDSVATGVTVAQMREMRPGALVTNALEADIEMVFGTASLSAELEGQLQLQSHAV